MAKSTKNLVAACIQLNSGSVVSANMARTETLLQQAADQGAQLALLPENFALMSSDDASKHHFSKHQAQAVTAQIKGLACRLNMWIVAGSMITPIANSDRLHNSSIVFSPDGTCTAQYHKNHLFDAVLDDKDSYQESHLFCAGEHPAHTYIEGWSVGLSICFDLRFPQLFQHYRNHGCQILTLPAAFAATTGVHHWMPLLQARAIETQCYILAAAQWGRHSGNRTTWGHSMIIDPWGEIIAKLPQEEGVICATLRMEQLAQVRRAIPMQSPSLHHP
ncbi:MAG: carbon-nitrogen hydrolase family protein [Mariprofundales bacterium]